MIYLIALQVLICVLIMWVLKRLLHRELMEVAMEEYMGMKKPEGKTPEIKVTSAAPLNVRWEERLKAIAHRNFEAKEVLLEIDRTMGAGVVLRVGNETIDCSLKSRLKEIF